MAIAEKELKLILSNSFPNAYIELKDMVGDEDHYSLTIQDPSFIGLSIIDQHKLVKASLKDILNKTLHSITIKTVAK